MAEVSNSKLLTTDTGILNKDACIVIIKTEWNAAIVDELERGCREVLIASEVREVRTIVVPGAVEIPFAVKKFWDTNYDTHQRPAAFIALGCVVKGDTPHFEYVCQLVTQGVLQLNLALPVPTVVAEVTVNNDEQAHERIGGKHGHKGQEAAITALKMITVVQSF